MVKISLQNFQLQLLWGKNQIFSELNFAIAVSDNLKILVKTLQQGLSQELSNLPFGQTVSCRNTFFGQAKFSILTFKDNNLERPACVGSPHYGSLSHDANQTFFAKPYK